MKELTLIFKNGIKVEMIFNSSDPKQLKNDFNFYMKNKYKNFDGSMKGLGVLVNEEYALWNLPFDSLGELGIQYMEMEGN